MNERIRWDKEPEGRFFVTTGHVGTLDEPLFEIYPPDDRDDCWILTSHLPGWHNRQMTADPDADDSLDFLKDEAEVWLGSFLVSLGAVFPVAAEEPSP